MNKEKCFHSLILSIFMQVNTIYFYDIYKYGNGFGIVNSDMGYYLPPMHIMNLTYEVMPPVEFSVLNDSVEKGCAFALLQPD